MNGLDSDVYLQAIYCPYWLMKKAIYTDGSSLVFRFNPLLSFTQKQVINCQF